jgi:hypothetical protein
MAFEVAWHKLILYLELLSKIALLPTTLEDPSHGRHRHAKIVHDILEVTQRVKYRFDIFRATDLAPI